MIRLKKILIFILTALFLFLFSSFQSSSLQLNAQAQETENNAPYKGIPEGYKIVEGDILIPSDAIKGVYITNLWPNGVVPYEFDPNVSYDNQTRMLGAMAEWHNTAYVHFFPRNGEAAYLYISDSDGNWSGVGYNGARVSMGIYNWSRKFIIAHELAHALGFWHEQSRLDRDTYVTIEWDRIQSGEEHNFSRHDEADVYGDYDFDSVMHYDQCAFSTCEDCSSNPDSCRSITVKPPWDDTWQDAIGQKSHLSVTDQATMEYLYSIPEGIFVDQSYTGSLELGTYWFPFKLFSSGVSAVPSDGTIIIHPGVYNAVGVYTKSMTLRAPLGNVELSE